MQFSSPSPPTPNSTCGVLVDPRGSRRERGKERKGKEKGKRKEQGRPWRAARQGRAPPTPRLPRRSERAASDKPLCRGLTFNRSQRGSCSATYETPTQKQVVYEWFSARFPTNMRCVTGEGAAPFPAAPRVPGRGALHTGPRSQRTADRPRAAAGPPAGTAGDRLSEANRGSAALPYRSAWAGF